MGSLSPYLFEENRKENKCLKDANDKFYQGHSVTCCKKENQCDMKVVSSTHANRFANFNGEKTSNAGGNLYDPFGLCAKLNLSDAECKKYLENQEKLTQEYGQSRSKKSFEDWYKEFAETERGKELLGYAKTGLGSLLDKWFPKDDAINTIQQEEEPNLILGMKPMTFVVVAVAGVGLLATILVFTLRKK